MMSKRAAREKRPTKINAISQNVSSFAYQWPRITARSRTPALTPMNQVEAKRPWKSAVAASHATRSVSPSRAYPEAERWP